MKPSTSHNLFEQLRSPIARPRRLLLGNARAVALLLTCLITGFVIAYTVAQMPASPGASTDAVAPTQEAVNQEIAQFTILHPYEANAALAPILTDEQRAAHAQASLSITNPAAYEAQLDQLLTPDQLSQRLDGMALVRMSFDDPVRYRAIKDAQMTPEEREARDQAVANVKPPGMAPGDSAPSKDSQN